MAPTTCFSSSGEASASTSTSTSPNPSENDPKSGKVEEGPRESTDAGEDRATQDKPSNKLDRMVEGDQELNQETHPPLRCARCEKLVEEHEKHLKDGPINLHCQKCEDFAQLNNISGICPGMGDHHREIYCSRCDHHSLTVEEHNTHIKTSPRHFCCQHCDDVVQFRDVPSLHIHYEVCHRLVYCWTCDHYSASVEEHRIHIKTSPRHFCCRYCDDGVEVAGAYFLRAHYQNCHPSLYCSVCDRLFATIEERSVHIKTSPLHFCCQTCDDVVDFSNVFSLRQHYRDCHPLLSCSACYDHFPTVAELSAHMQETHYPCDGCHEYFSEPTFLKYHRMTCEKVHPPLSCDGCHEIFYNPTILKWHREICDQVHPPLPCDGCHEYFSDPTNLKRHREICDKVHPPLPCDGCHEYFSDPTNLKWHREICDKVNFPHRCEGCHEGFVHPALLQRHRKTCKKVNPPRKSKIPQNHYATLGISPRSSHEQIVKAAKEMRVKVHPDRLKRQGGLTKEQEENIDVEAALVGQAADILSDPLSRAKYDRKLRG